ncbi:MAG: hypothetical protein AB8H03_25235 [Saprospiraceae bacterium]
MEEEIFISIFNQSIQFISDDWKAKYNRLLHDEHWDVIAKRISSYVLENKIDHNPLPIFSEEIISDYPSHYQYFEKLKSSLAKNENQNAQLIANTIEKTPIESLLVILGQRKTPATISDKNGIPPLKNQLLKSSFELYNEQICKAARAREKHISRNEADTFWGKIEGTPMEKEQAAKTIVRKIVEEKTWWNIFTHYKHEVVYEIRVASGQGIRWKLNNLELIGFLEPFK